MPLVRIDVPEGTETEKKRIIHKRVREVVLKTLAPKQVKYDYVSIREAYGIIGDGLPVIDVDLRPGREPERKKGLVDGIAGVLNETMGITCIRPLYWGRAFARMGASRQIVILDPKSATLF